MPELGLSDRPRISAERKSVYDDLRLLESFGMDVETVKGGSSAITWESGPSSCRR